MSGSCAIGCAGGSERDWPEVKEWVRGEFPDVPQTTVDELHARLADEGTAQPVLLDARARLHRVKEQSEALQREVSLLQWMLAEGEKGGGHEIVREKRYLRRASIDGPRSPGRGTAS